jgi:signal transduction histidine kinase
MSEFQTLYQLSRQIMQAIGASLEPAALLCAVGEFWAADVCWCWQEAELLVYDPSQHWADRLSQQPEQPPVLANLEVMWASQPQGYLALARSTPWNAAQQDQLAEIAPLVAIALAQLTVQKQVETAKQSVRQVQALVDERTAQFQSSQSLLAKMREVDRRRIQQLDQNNRLKDEFISTISHELRTPLTSMALAIKMLRKPGIDPDKQAKYLEILEQQCSQEVALINDLLTIQKLESKELPQDLQAVQLQSLVEPIAAQFRATWAHKQLTLLIDLPAPFAWYTEPDSVNRILQELLTNAGKFAHPQTTVELQGKIAADRLILRTIDQGKAIADEEKIHIFEKFRRGAGITEQAIGGTGLGLALAKSLVQHLGGEISAHSQGIEPDAEVCFEVSLPLVAKESSR